MPLSTGEPQQGELLPCNDNDWIQGLVGSNDALFTASPMFATPGLHFATICRASHILGRVLRHKGDHLLSFPDRLSEAFQLHRTLLALEASITCQAMPDELRTCDLPRAFICSARFILYEMYACNERYESYKLGQETDMQKICLESLSTVTLTVAQIAQRLKEDWDMGVKGHSPLLAHCMYQALGECAWLVREEPSQQMKFAFITIADALRCMSQQWAICGKSHRQRGRKMVLTLARRILEALRKLRGHDHREMIINLPVSQSTSARTCVNPADQYHAQTIPVYRTRSHTSSTGLQVKTELQSCFLTQSATEGNPTSTPSYFG